MPFLINDAPPFKVTALNIALFDASLFNLALFDAALFDVELLLIILQFLMLYYLNVSLIMLHYFITFTWVMTVFMWVFIPAKKNFFNSESDQSFITFYMKYPVMKVIVGAILLRSFWQKWNFISDDKMLWKHHPKMKSNEKKHLQMRI